MQRCSQHVRDVQNGSSYSFYIRYGGFMVVKIFCVIYGNVWSYGRLLDVSDKAAVFSSTFETAACYESHNVVI